VVSGYAQKFKMTEPSDPLEVVASAGATLSTPEKTSISRKRKVQTNAAEKKRNVPGSLDPNVSAWDRINEFKDHCLTIGVGKSKILEQLLSNLFGKLEQIVDSPSAHASSRSSPNGQGLAHSSPSFWLSPSLHQLVPSSTSWLLLLLFFFSFHS